MKNKSKISIILPVYNEEKVVKANLKKLYKFLKENFETFEILMCDNGSKDKTGNHIIELQKTRQEIRYIKIPKKGLGLGIKGGIENAKYDYLFFYAIDLPFGLEIINESIANMKKYDIVIGSKRHKKSINNHSFKRKVFSLGYNTLLNTFFRLGVKDSQGSLMFKRKNIEKYLKYLKSEDAFLETEILIYGKLFKNRIIEIPVVYKEQRKGSKINPVKDGLSMLKQMVREYVRLKKIEGKVN